MVLIIHKNFCQKYNFYYWQIQAPKKAPLPDRNEAFPTNLERLRKKTQRGSCQRQLNVRTITKANGLRRCIFIG